MNRPKKPGRWCSDAGSCRQVLRQRGLLFLHILRARASNMLDHELSRPCTGQALAEAHHALHKPVAEMAKRHPGQAQVLYGNGRGGWVAALPAADCVGPAQIEALPPGLYRAKIGMRASACSLAAQWPKGPRPRRVSRYASSERGAPWVAALASLYAIRPSAGGER